MQMNSFFKGEAFITAYSKKTGELLFIGESGFENSPNQEAKKTNNLKKLLQKKIFIIDTKKFLII